MAWELLGLDRDTATAREVKRAYAKLLRNCRPEKDPEGFEKLHEAYQSALAELEWRDLEAVEEEDEERIVTRLSVEEAGIDAEEEEFVGRSNVEIFPPDICESADRLKEALGEGDEEKIRSEVSSLTQTLTGVPNAIGIWQKVFISITEDEKESLLDCLPPKVLINELALDQNDFSFGVVNYCREKERFEQLDDLAREILRNKEILRNESAGEVAAALAVGLSVMKYDRAEELLDYAFEFLPKSKRDWEFTMMEHQIAMGSAFVRFPWDQRVFWTKCLEDPEEQDWESQECRDAVVGLVEKVPSDWMGFQRIEYLLPDDLLERLSRIRKKREKEELKEAKRTQASETNYGWLLWVVVFLVFKSIVLSDGCSENHSRETYVDSREKIDEIVAARKLQAGKAEINRRVILQRMAGEFPQIVDLEKQAPKGKAVTGFFKKMKEEDLKDDKKTYEALVAYTLLSRPDRNTTEVMLRSIPMERSLAYLNEFRKSFNFEEGLLIRKGIQNVLDDHREVRISPANRIKLVKVSKGFLVIGGINQSNEK